MGVPPALPTAARLNAIEGSWRDLPRLAWWSFKATLVGRWGLGGIAVIYAFAWLSLTAKLTPNVSTFAATLAVAQTPAAAAVAALVTVIAIGSWGAHLILPNRRVYLSIRRDAALVLILRPRSRTIEPTNHVVRNVGQGQGHRFRVALGPPLFQELNNTSTRLQARVTSRIVRDTYLSEWGPYGLQISGPRRVAYVPPGWIPARP